MGGPGVQEGKDINLEEKDLYLHSIRHNPSDLGQCWHAAAA